MGRAAERPDASPGPRVGDHLDGERPRRARSAVVVDHDDVTQRGLVRGQRVEQVEDALALVTTGARGDQDGGTTHVERTLDDGITHLPATAR